MAEQKKYKVLHIITLFSVGGATENTVFTVKGLRDLGYEVDLATGPNISSEGSMYEYTERNKIPVFTFRRLKRNISPINDCLIIYQLYKFIKTRKYDIVHTHSSKAGVVGRIAAQLAGTKLIIHHNHANPYHRFQSFPVRTTFKRIEKISSLFCDKIFSVSYTIVEEMVKDKIAPRKKFEVVRSGFDIEKFKNFDNSNDFKLREKLNISNDEIILGMIARLSVIKGHIYLLRSFKKVCDKIPNVKLLLIGDGENKENLVKFINENRLNSKVIFTGLVPPTEVPAYISILDIVVHTALLEGLPRVFTQSMLMGKPVISFDLDGAHEVIDDGKNGYLIEPLNIEMLTEKIIDLSKHREKIIEFGNYAKNNIKDDFSIEAMVNNNHRLYQELLNQKL